jgi:hypothetical protein
VCVSALTWVYKSVCDGSNLGAPLAGSAIKKKDAVIFP